MLTEKEGGHHVYMQEPKSLKWNQYVHQSMYCENHRDCQIPEYDEHAYRRHQPGEAFSTSPRQSPRRDEGYQEWAG